MQPDRFPRIRIVSSPLGRFLVVEDDPSCCETPSPDQSADPDLHDAIPVQLGRRTSSEQTSHPFAREALSGVTRAADKLHVLVLGDRRTARPNPQARSTAAAAIVRAELDIMDAEIAAWIAAFPDSHIEPGDDLGSRDSVNQLPEQG